MLFKRGSTISAAEGGCQAEVGGEFPSPTFYFSFGEIHLRGYFKLRLYSYANAAVYSCVLHGKCRFCGMYGWCVST
jgi:hypothetical protein